MAGGKKRDVLVRIGADDSEFRKKAKDSADAFDKLAGIGKTAATVIATAFVAATSAVAALTVKGLALGDELEDLSKRMGTTADFMAEMGHVARMSGTSLSELEQGFAKLAKRGPLEEQLNLYADRFAALTTHTERAQLATEIFGDRVGAKLIPLLSQGAGGLQEMRAEASRLGLTLDEVQKKNISEANDALDRLKSAGEGLSLQLASAFAPAIEAAADAIQWLTEKVIEALPRLQAMAERLLGIKAAAEDLSDAALQESLIEQIKALDDVNNRIAVQRGLLESLHPLAADRVHFERVLTGLVAEQENTQARINELLAERVKRRRAAEAPKEEEKPQVTLTQEEADYETKLLGDIALERERFRELELQQEADWRQALFEAREEFAAQEIEAERALVDALMIERQRYSEELAAQDQADIERAKETKRQTVDNAFSAFTEVTAMLSSHNKKMFQLNKVAAKAEAALNAYRAIQQVWADPTLPFYAKIAATAITAVKTAANISAINSTNFGGGTTPSAAGGSTVNGFPVPQERVIIARGINPNDIFSGRQLVEILNEATKDGAKLVLAN